MDRLAAEEFEEAERYDRWRERRAQRRAAELELVERVALLVCIVAAVVVAALLLRAGDRASAAGALAAAGALGGVRATLGRGAAPPEPQPSEMVSLPSPTAIRSNEIEQRSSATSGTSRSSATSSAAAPPA